VAYLFHLCQPIIFKPMFQAAIPDVVAFDSLKGKRYINLLSSWDTGFRKRLYLIHKPGRLQSRSKDSSALRT
jgi:hypothetical protein